MSLRISARIILITVLSTSSVSAQVLRPDVTRSFYAEMWNVYNTHKHLSYIAFPFMRVNGDNGFPVLFEANISPYFTFYRGRDYGTMGYSKPHLKSLMIYFNPEMTLRMYRQEPIGVATRSLPVLPINFVPRISVVKFLHKATVLNRQSKFRNYQFIEFSVAHFSNGQENPHYLRDTVRAVSGDSIPNYASGNFSTNYLKLSYGKGHVFSDAGILSGIATVQNDGGIGDLFSFDGAQRKSYGKWRLGLNVQYQTGPRCLGEKKSQKVELRIVRNDSTKLEEVDAIRKYFATWRFRYVQDMIVDDVSQYPSEEKRRMAHRLTVLFHPLNWRNVALMAEAYYGRDFYNIRFYDSIFQVKIGLVADGAFYVPRNILYDQTR
jgi:hypothetical protein